MIGIINTNLGNINAIINIYTELGVASMKIDKSNQLDNVNKIIIPGIGSFDTVINHLKQKDIYNKINSLVLHEGIPILGICIGMHIFYEQSEEGNLPGFGWVRGKIKKMENINFRYPHMGWNEIDIKKSNNLFKGIHTGDYFYFLHSYSNKYEKDDGTIITTSNYGEEFISAMNIRNIYGVQFHPEKSHKVGMKLLSNFASSCA